MAKAIDLTNQKFGKLTVIERDYSYCKEHNLKREQVYWKCKCDCGNEISVSASALRTGGTTQCPLCKCKNEVGNRYGRLVVLRPAKLVGKSKGNKSWVCKCDCGNETIVQGWHLRSGNTTSCGCYHSEICKNRKLITNKMSIQEEVVYKLLQDNNIQFIFDEPYFKDLLTPNGGIARYDFIILDNNKPIRLIEIDGQQHFEPVKIFGGKTAFEERLKMDTRKNEYAKSHNLPLVRLPYTLKENITIDMILGNEYLV